MADVGIKIRATDEASGVFGKVAAEAGKLQGAVSNVGSSFAALGTAAIAGMSVISFAGQIKQTIDLADSFNKLSQKTGIAVEDFSKLNYAASLADVSTETLAAGMRKLNLSIADAAGGNKEKAALFNALGVSFKDAAGQALSADKVFSSLSDALAKSADGAEKIAVGSDLMGRGFEGLVPLVNTGAKGLADMGDEAKKLGIVMGADFAKNAEEFNDNLRRINVAGQGLFVTLAGDLVKGLGDAAREMAQAAIDGGKLAGVIAGIQTLFTGTDQYKNDKKLVEQTELMLSLEKSLTVARKSGNAAYIKSREDALAAVNAEIKTTMSYRKLLQDMETDKKKNEPPKPTGVTPNVKAANALLGSSGNGPKTPKDTANAFAGEQEAAKEWAKAYEGATKARDDLIAKNLGLSKSEEDLKRYMEGTAAAINEKTNPAMNAMVQSALQANIALETMGKLADTIEAQQKRTSTAEEETAKERDRVAAIGLTEQAIAELNATRLEEMATAKERSLMAAKEIDLSGELAESIKAEVKALRERAGLARLGSLKESEVAAAKAAADEWKRGWEDTDRLARDVFSSWATDGGNAAQKIGDTLKKALLSAIYEATLKPIAFQLYTSVVGGGGAATAMQAASGYGGVANLASGASSIYSTGASLLTNFSGAVSSGITNIGAAMINSGSEMLGDFGASLVSNSSAIGAAAESIGSGLGYLSAAIAASKGEWGKAIGAGLGTYFFGPIGGAIGSAIGSAVDKAFGGGHEYSVAHGVRLTAGKDGLKTQAFDQWRNDGSSGFFGMGGASASTGINYSDADVKLSKQLGDAYAALQTTTGAFATALGLNAEHVKNVTADLIINVDGLSADEAQKKISEAFTTLADSLASAYTDSISAFARDGETASGTLARLATDLNAVNGTFSALGYTLMDVSVAGGAAAAGLVDAMGGLQSFQAQTAALFQNFYTADEQKAYTVNSVATSLGAAGITGFTKDDIANASREQIRAVVDQYAGKVGTETGDKQYAAIVAAANALTTYVPDFAEAAAAVVPTVQAAASSGGGGGGGSPAPDTALSAWQDATDAIVETMADLRSALVGDGPNSFAKLQAQFVIETAKAKAGDLAAAQDLPELAKSLADANKANATSSVQQAIFTARIVETLGSVAGLGNLGRSISVPAFAAGGLHSGGWAMVGEHGPELVNMPSARVYNAQDTRAMLGGQDNAALVAAIEKLQAELAAIRASSATTASASAKTAKHIDAAANGGRPLAMTAV